MLSKAVNGFSSTEVDKVIRGYYGDPTWRYRAELVDRDGNKIRDITSSIDMTRSGISHNAAATDIRRSADVLIRETTIELDDWEDLVVSTAPLFFWRLGEPSGTTANDASGNGRTGTYNGTPTLGAASLVEGDPTNTAVTFDGTNDDVTIADASWMDVTAISLMASIKTSASGTRAFMSRFPSGVAGWVLRLENGVIAFYFFSGGNLKSAVSSAIVNDNLNHIIIVTYDNQNIRIYLDGIRVFKTAQTALLENITSSIRVGSSDGANFFSGTIDEAAMWGRGLSVEEVRQLSQRSADNFSQINFDTDYLKIYGAVKMKTNGTDGTPYAEWPMFMGKLSSPTRSALETGIERPCQLNSLESILQNDTFQTRHTISAAANYITGTNAILSIVQAAGFDTTTWAIDATTKTLPATLDFEIGTSRLEAVNLLLQAINYHPLRFNGNGQGVIKAYVLPDERAVEDTLATGESGIIIDDMEEQVELDQVDNKVIVVRANPDATTIQSEQTNSDVTSSTGTVLTGRTRTRLIPTQAVDQTTLDALASREIALSANRTTRVRIQTPHRPFHDDEDIISLIDEGLENSLGISAVYIEEEWRLPLDPIQPMSHVLRQIQQV